MLAFDTLVGAFRNAGLNEGDIALVHSSMKGLGPVEGGAETVIRALMTALGPEGTLALPTHTWAVVGANQPVFHELLTPSNVGYLTNFFRKYPGVRRSLHPTHSVAALGKRADELVVGHELDETPCSPDSPYGRLAEWGGKVFIIGKGLECCTFFHCTEEVAGCGSWSITEHHEHLYTITADGRIIDVPSRRHRNGVSDNYPRLEGYLVELGYLKITYLGGCKLYCLDARPAGGWLEARLRENTRFLW